MKGLIALAALLAAPLAAQVTLDANLTLAIDPREPGPIQKAARDLGSDLRKVFGKEVRTAAQPSSSGASIVIAFRYNLPAGVARPTTPETLLIQAKGRSLVLTGSDVRGTIYAIYEFSRSRLGVDPFWYWTDHDPPRRASLKLAANLREQDGPPVFRYRGWFNNDEDLLTGWKPGDAEGSCISLEAWDHVFEALLRTRGNMITPGTFIFPDEPQNRAASERGLIVTQHHIEVVGLNTWRWPDDQPYSIFSRPDLLEKAWRAAVKQYGDRDLLWTLGYRGRHDRPFWSDDKAAPSTDEGRAKAIRAAIDTQIKIVREARRQPYFLMNAWMEAVSFIRGGSLTIPPGVTLVWPDNGHGVIRDEGTIAKGQGVYYHTAMLNGVANQLSEMVPVARIRRELGRAYKAGATEYLLDNTSDVRPVVMSTGALMEMAWNPAAWMKDGADDEYVLRWSREQFGSRAAPLVAAYFKAYWEAPARYGEGESETFGDNAYFRTGREVLLRFFSERNSRPRNFFPEAKYLNEYCARLAVICRQAAPRWDKTLALAEKARPAIPAERLPFFEAYLLTQTRLHLHANRMLLAISDAVAAAGAERVARLRTAVEEAHKAVAALDAADYGKWKGFYASDVFVNTRYTEQLVRACLAKYSGDAAAAPPPAPPDGYRKIKAQQGERRVALE
jgi:hypothetical protein